MAAHRGEQLAIPVTQEAQCESGQIHNAIKRLHSLFNGAEGDYKSETQNGERVGFSALRTEEGMAYFVTHRHNAKHGAYSGNVEDGEEVETCYVLFDGTENGNRKQTLSCTIYSRDAERSFLEGMNKFYATNPSDEMRESMKRIFSKKLTEIQVERGLMLDASIGQMNASMRDARDLNEILRGTFPSVNRSETDA